jgi:hypothetical protein
MFKNNLSFLVILLLAVVATPISAGPADSSDSFELRGRGIQNLEIDLEGNDQVKPDGFITVTINNNHPGYKLLLIHLSRRDGEDEEVVVGSALANPAECNPGSTCVVKVPNTPVFGITANEVGVTGVFGHIGSKATVSFVTTNP